MEQTLFAFIWRNSTRQQVIILCITVLSFPILYLSLELPKIIINDAISDSGNPFPREYFGHAVEQIPYLLILCFAFLGLVVLNNVVKYVLNVYKGLLGERMLRRLRYDLFHRILRFRLPQFRKISQGEIIPIITGEVEQIGGFVGEAIATPAFQGGTLMVYLVFIFNQDPLLGAAAIALYPVQAYIIPKLQMRVNKLSRQRVLNTRKLADRIGEGIAGINEVHANDATAWHLAEVSQRLYTNFAIRFRIFRLKYQIKFLNNFLNQLTPFFFYSIGGYLVIKGELTFGALVAVLAAYKDLAGPWRELLTWYQQLMDMRVKYETVIENFDLPDLVSPARLSEERDHVSLAGDIELAATSVEIDGDTALSDATVSIAKGSTVAVVGDDDSGRAEMLQAMAGLLDVKNGSLTINGEKPFELPEAVIGRRLAYIRGDGFIFNGTIRGNLLYGLRNRPVQPRPLEGEAVEEERLRKLEAERTANSDHDAFADWDNLAAAGAVDATDLDLKALGALSVYGLGDQVFRMGLLGRLDPHAYPDIAEAIVATRKAFCEIADDDPRLAAEIEHWDAPGIRQSQALIASVFGGLPRDPGIDTQTLLEQQNLVAVLDAVGIGQDLETLGRSVADTIIDLFAELPDTDLVADFGIGGPEDIEELTALSRSGKRKPPVAARQRFMALALDIVPARHRFVDMPEALADRFDTARDDLRKRVDEQAPDLFSWFDRDAYLAPASVLENLIFGQPRLDRVSSRETLETALSAYLREHGLENSVARIGLDFEVGVAGGRLTPQQRRTINFVRGLLKRPDVVVVEEVAQSPLVPDRLIAAIREQLPEATIVAGMSDGRLAGCFEKAILLKSGRIAEVGAPDDVIVTETTSPEATADGVEAPHRETAQ